MTRLLYTKSKTASLKIVSLPRLQVYGALLLVKLTTGVKSVLVVHINKVLRYTHSIIVLSWSGREPHTYIYYTVSEISNLIGTNDWYNVSTIQPILCISVLIQKNKIFNLQSRP